MKTYKAGDHCRAFIAKWGGVDESGPLKRLPKPAQPTKRTLQDEAVGCLCALGHKKREAERLVSQSSGDTVQEIIANVYAR